MEGLEDEPHLVAEEVLPDIAPELLQEDAGNDDEVLTQGRRLAQNMVDIGHRASPIVPPPDSTVQDRDADGFSLIGRVGAWSCLLVKFSMLDSVPHQHQEQWVAAWAEILRRWSNAVTEKEADNALMWWLILPPVLLRKPFRGGRGGRSLVA